MIDYILARLKEPSTYAGAATLLALVGWKLSPELMGAIASAGIAVIALIEIVRREKQ
jgi:hypothetical protein